MMEQISQKRLSSAPRLLEDLLLKDGGYYLLEGHLRRLRQSAGDLGFKLDEAGVHGKLEQLARQHRAGRFRIRLVCAKSGEIQAGAVPLGPVPPRKIRLKLAPRSVLSGDAWVRHKTTCRPAYDRALALHAGCDDVLLANECDEITEACRANLVYRLQDSSGRLYTPARRSGLQDGVLRRHLLDRGILTERALPVSGLSACTGLWLINSVRKWMRVEEVVGGWSRTAAQNTQNSQ